jgi:hypothetical protein
MGSYTGNNVYLPDIDEKGWGNPHNNNWTMVDQLVSMAKARTMVGADDTNFHGLVRGDARAFRQSGDGSDWTLAIMRGLNVVDALWVPRNSTISTKIDLSSAGPYGALKDKVIYGDGVGSLGAGLGGSLDNPHIKCTAAMAECILTGLSTVLRGIHIEGYGFPDFTVRVGDDYNRIQYCNFGTPKNAGTTFDNLPGTGQMDIYMLHLGGPPSPTAGSISCMLRGADIAWFGGRVKGSEKCAVVTGSQHMFAEFHCTSQGAAKNLLDHQGAACMYEMVYLDSGLQDQLLISGTSNLFRSIKSINAGGLSADLTYSVIVLSADGNIIGPVLVTPPSNGNRWQYLVKQSGSPVGCTVGPGYILGVQGISNAAGLDIMHQIHGDADNPNRVGYSQTIRKSRNYGNALFTSGQTTKTITPHELWAAPTKVRAISTDVTPIALSVTNKAATAFDINRVGTSGTPSFDWDAEIGG